MTSNEITPIVRKLRSKEARDAGWTVIQSRGTRHYAVRRDGILVATLPHSSGGGRGIRNAKAELRRAGFTLL